jgi:ribonuclease/clavin/mitogillin
MSEPLPGMPAFEMPVVPLRDAAAVVVFRKVAAGAEVFWIKREKQLRFAGGFYAFPGGKVDAADRAIAVEGASGDAAALIVTAARELLEETGLLKARTSRRIAPDEISTMRTELLEETVPFAELLKRHALTLHAADFVEAGRWATPPFLPVRFDARFFLVEAPQGQEAEVWPGELSEGAWIAPAMALRRWREGTALLHPPNHHALAVMAGFKDAESARVALSSAPHVVDFVAERIEFQQGVKLFPLKTLTLPPATHTNAYVLGTKELLVVDPGSVDDAETDRLVAMLLQLQAEGATIKAVVLTHHHGDHVGGLVRLVERLKLPVWSHPRTADRLELKTDRLLVDGEVIALGEMRWRVLHTPGHAQGHVCLYDEGSKAAVVGDMVAGIGTIVIDPPEGEMGDYLAQLKRLEALPVTTLYPSHGPAIPDGPGKLAEYLKHRLWREEKVLAALGADPITLEELVPRAYDDVNAFVLPIAERSTLAILGKLEREGRVSLADGRYRVS